MDERRFDAALRALQAGTTRRAGLARMLAVLLGGAGISRGEASGPETEGPCGDGSAKDNRCKKHADCCTKYCPGGACRCKPNYMTCTKDAHCCSGRCVSGRCDGGCRPAGGICEEDFNCCDGMICKNGACTKSPKASCTKQNCPGCCDGTTCRVGASSVACGAKGAACTRCRNGEDCRNGTCGAAPACSPATCPKGCCQAGVCKPGTKDGACGTGGAACTACSGNKTCQNGTCKGGGGGGCSAATCPNGCCDGGSCVPGTDDDACGTGGGRCDACTGGKACQAKVCQPVCDGTTCPNGCCSGGTCLPGTANDACGADGSACAACTGGDVCQSQVCQSVCDATSCANGCCDGGTCVPGTDDDACGIGGGACVNCGDSDEVCDTGTQTCRAGTWSYSAQFGSEGSGDDNFSEPTGIAVSPDSLTAWVADAVNDRIAIWTRPDAASTTWSYSAQFATEGSGNPNLDNPKGVWVSADTLTAWVADTDNNRIVIWTRPDVSSTTWSYSAKFGGYGDGDGNFNQPYSVFVSADTLTAWVADYNNSRISIWKRPDASSTSWSYNAQFGTYGSGDDNLDSPAGVAVSVDTLTAWVIDENLSRVVIWTRPDAASTTWSYSAQFGSFGNGNDNFWYPTGLAVSTDSQTVWVADNFNARIMIWALG